MKNPSQHEVMAWKAEQVNFGATTVRESGLYHLCFRKLKGASSKITLFYSFDFISTGSRTLTLMPSEAATVSKTEPSVLSDIQVKLETVDGQVTKMGILQFRLNNVSPSIFRDQTRVKLLLTMDTLANGEFADIVLALLPDRLQSSLTWEKLGSYATGDYNDHVYDSARMEIGSHVAYDITEIFESKINDQTETITFSIHADGNTEVDIFGKYYASQDHVPQIVVEGASCFVHQSEIARTKEVWMYVTDLGLELMHEVAYFKESVFTLRGDMLFLKHRERMSRDSTSSLLLSLA